MWWWRRRRDHSTLTGLGHGLHAAHSFPTLVLDGSNSDVREVFPGLGLFVPTTSHSLAQGLLMGSIFTWYFKRGTVDNILPSKCSRCMHALTKHECVESKGVNSSFNRILWHLDSGGSVLRQLCSEHIFTHRFIYLTADKLLWIIYFMDKCWRGRVQTFIL